MRESASIRMATYQQRAAAHYNCKAQPRVFKVGRLILKRVFENTVEKGVRKFQANWEGPTLSPKQVKAGLIDYYSKSTFLLLETNYFKLF